ncbi:alpha/beta fold hydrolase [Kocuria sp.]|uniref:alpha/beta fold hydrolase n=1 Tax=Kocuria sp. TaxID=1871328 RepID=UPI0026E0EE49|nr:alpha/beta fold hydrolase [Kocuria sp.]MDO5619325.1 alpha/beta fold hydrolase [Kocuria sp.]
MPRTDQVSLTDYAAFLPARQRAKVVVPDHDWWPWRGSEVHLLRAGKPDAPVRLVVVHGAGAHAEALWPLASLVASEDVDITALDLPLYGKTQVSQRSTVRYEQWVELLRDFLVSTDDGRPVALLGGSIGGLLAVEAAARAGNVSAVVATCLLDPSTSAARACMTRFGRAALPFMTFLPLVRGPVARIPIKISWTAKLSAMGRNPDLGKLCARDSRGGGAWVPMAFLASYLQYKHAAARSNPVRVHLVHPQNDDWTPIALSQATLNQLPGPTQVTVLRNCGHFPLEEPGLSDLMNIVQRITKNPQNYSY